MAEKSKEDILFEKIQGEISTEVEKIKSELEKGKLTKDDLTTAMQPVNDKVKQLEEMLGEKKEDSQPVYKMAEDIQAQVDKLNEKLEAFNHTGKQAETFADQLIQKAPDLVSQYNEKKHGKIELNLKTSPIDMGLTTAITGQIPQAEREPGIAHEPKRQPLLLSLIRTGTTNSNKLEWIEKETELGEPAFKAEFESYPKRSWKSKVASTDVKKLGVLAEYSKEILEDVDYFQAELRRDLVEQLQFVLDKNILEGDGNSDDLVGIKELDDTLTWDNDDFQVANPSLYDVIAVGVNQVETAHHNPSVIMMHPKTAMTMKLTKDDNNNYVMPPFAAANGVRVEGLPVVTNTLMGEKEIIIMDGSVAQLVWKRNWTIDISDSHGENFDKDVLAVRLSGRAALKIKGTDAKAFCILSDYDTAITALTPSS